MSTIVPASDEVVVHKTVRKKFTKGRISLLLMALPFIALTFAFNYVPIFGWIYAFFNYMPGVPLSQSQFVGLEWFKMAFEGGQFGQVMTDTLVLSFLGLLVSPLPVIFAICLSEIRFPFFKKMIQTTTTLPNFISWVLVYSVFYAFFSVDTGVVNNVLMKLHLIHSPTNVLGNDHIAWYFQTAVGIWKGVGWGSIIYLAAMAGIDQELYDAAKVDGANRFKLIWHITVPGIIPTYIVLLVLGVGGILSNGFEQYFVFNNPLVAHKLNVLDYYVYQVGITMNEYSYGTAVGIFKTIVSLILVFSVNRVAKKLRGQSVF